jgi:signal peptidase I
MALDFERLHLFQELLDRGLSLRVKATGMSMSPFLHGGELLWIRKVASSSLRRGDLVFCRSSEGFALIHRIIRIWQEGNGECTLQTKGDALGAPDQAASERQVLGKVFLIERMNSTHGCRVIDMESKVWRAINRLMAWISLISPRKLVPGRLVYKILPNSRLSSAGIAARNEHNVGRCQQHAS